MDIYNNLVLYLAIIWCVFSVITKFPIILPIIIISIVLYEYNLPDIKVYKEFFELASIINFEILKIDAYKYEIGYIYLNILFSQFVSFHIFYIIVISTVLYCSIKFFISLKGEYSYVYVSFFLSFCLYFLSFTLRTSIASIFLILALINLFNKKENIALIYILVGSLFHIVILYAIIYVILIKRKKIVFFLLLLFFLFFIIYNHDSFKILGFINDKILIYKEDENFKLSLFLLIWIILIFYSIYKFEYLHNFNKILIIGMFITILFLINNSFIMGRIFWISSIIFTYCLVNLLLNNLIFQKNMKFISLLLIPLVIFTRNFDTY